MDVDENIELPTAAGLLSSRFGNIDAEGGGPNSDDETLRFGEENDDLYSSDADEADARWARKQVI